MGPSNDLQLWAGRACLGLVGLLGMLGYHFANIRFVPIAMGFAILAGICYFWRVVPVAAPRPLSNSGSHRAL